MLRLKKYDKIILLYLLVYSFVFIPTLAIPSIMSDEGTHMMLSLFYRDLITTIVKNTSLSFTKTYEFGISYLIHYPKLQVFYPPLYHLITGFVFYSILGFNAFAARFSNFLIGIISMIIFYIFSKKLLRPKEAVISTILFSLNPIALSFIRLAYKDFTTISLSFLTFYLYYLTTKNKKSSYFVIMGLASALTVLADMPGIILPITIFALMLFKKEEIKKISLFIIPQILILVPYLILIIKANGIEVNIIRFQLYSGFNTTGIFDLLILSPITILNFVFFFKYISNKKTFWRELLIWSIIAFIITMFMAYNIRFAQYFKLPAYLVSGYFLTKRKKILLLMIVLSVVISIYFIKNDYFPTYPVEEVVDFVYDNMPNGSNIAMINEKDNTLYSSSLMFPLSLKDEKKSTVFLRPCYFNNKSREEILEILQTNGIFYVIGIRDVSGYNRIDLIKDKLTIVLEKDIIEVYEFKDYKPDNEICNFICTTREVMCTNYDSPFDVYK